MKVIVDIKNKTLKMLGNDRAIFKGEYSADKLELFINKQLENEYPVITGLLSNGRRIGAFTTDDGYEMETIDGVEYTKAKFTLSKENGFPLSAGVTQITIWMYRTKDSVLVSKEAIGNVVFTVVDTTAFNDGDIIISGDVEGTVVNLKVELENLQSRLEQYLPLSGAKAMTGDLPMKGNNIIFDNGNEETIEIGEEDNEYSMSIRMEDSDYYKGRYRASGFSIGNDYIDATLDISESRFTMTLAGDRSSTITPDGFSVSKEGETYYEDGRVGRYFDDYSKHVEYVFPNKSGEFALKDDIPTKVSQLDNNRGFITNAVNNLTNYYLKSETYTKSEVQQLLSTISSLKLEVVTNLPTTNISSNTIYLKPLDSAKENNIYEEYIYINSKWETIGTTAVDLSNYALKKDIPTKISDLEQDVELGVSEEDVMNIVKNNAEQTETLDIGTSATFNPESDEQIPTSKAVANMMASAGDSNNIIDLGWVAQDLYGDEAYIELANKIKNDYGFNNKYLFTGTINEEGNRFLASYQEYDDYLTIRNLTYLETCYINNPSNLDEPEIIIQYDRPDYDGGNGISIDQDTRTISVIPYYKKIEVSSFAIDGDFSDEEYTFILALKNNGIDVSKNIKITLDTRPNYLEAFIYPETFSEVYDVITGNVMGYINSFYLTNNPNNSECEIRISMTQPLTAAYRAYITGSEQDELTNKWFIKEL